MKLTEDEQALAIEAVHWAQEYLRRKINDALNDARNTDDPEAVEYYTDTAGRLADDLETLMSVEAKLGGAA